MSGLPGQRVLPRRTRVAYGLILPCRCALQWHRNPLFDPPALLRNGSRKLQVLRYVVILFASRESLTVLLQPGKRRRVVEIPGMLYSTRNAFPDTDRVSLDDVIIRETEDTVILGEDPAEEYSEDDKPIRLLTDFSIIDPDGEYVTLTDLPYANGFGGRRRCEAIGNVSPVYEEEDAGQDDDYVDGSNDTERELQKLRTTAILQYTINYAEVDRYVPTVLPVRAFSRRPPYSPVYILTAHAWYMLSGPAERYKQEYLESYRRHRMAQLVISRAFDEPEETYQKFQDDFLKSYDELAGVHIKAQHLQDCVSSSPSLSGAG